MSSEVLDRSVTGLEFEKALVLDSRQNGIVGSITVACKLYEDNIRLRQEVEHLKEIIKMSNCSFEKDKQ